MIDKSKEEIDEVLNTVSEIKDSVGSRYAGMSYEDGVEYALRWVIGEGDHPFEED